MPKCLELSSIMDELDLIMNETHVLYHPSIHPYHCQSDSLCMKNSLYIRKKASKDYCHYNH